MANVPQFTHASPSETFTVTVFLSCSCLCVYNVFLRFLTPFVCLINYESICEKQINLNIKSHKSGKCLKSSLPLEGKESLPSANNQPQNKKQQEKHNLCSEFQIFFYSFQSRFLFFFGRKILLHNILISSFSAFTSC